MILSGGHRNDVTQLLPRLDAIPPIRGLRGQPRRRPGKVYADRGYDRGTRYERRADTHQTMISLACSIICLRNLRPLR